jgi:peptide/nickel transport system substrate-binding protein
MVVAGRQICIFGLMFAAGMFLTGCGSKRQSRDNVFYLNYSSGQLESIDPAFAKALYMMWTTKMVYNTLVEADENLHVIPSLAKSWQVSPDGLTYTFVLRDDVYFHDAPQFAGGRGRKMIASDAAYSFNRLIDPKVASTGAWVFNGRVAEKEPFRAIDDTTLQIKLLTPFRPMVAMLSMPYCSIVPWELAEYWGRDFRSHPCGTGPFMFKHWDEGNVLVLQKNNRYWQKDEKGTRLPYLDGVQITFVDSKATEFFLFLQRKLDFVNGLDGSFKDLVLSKNGELKDEFKKRFKLRKSVYLDTEYLGFLTDTASVVLKNSPVKDPFVRQAINYGIDRKRIVTYFRNGIGIPATSGFIPTGMPGYDSTGGYGYTYDPNKALELLAQAGYPNGKGLAPIKILTPDNWSDVINFIATQLQEIGIPIQVEIIQPNILKQQMSRSQAVFFRAQWIADYPDAETYLTVFNSAMPAPPNYTRFSNSAFDKLYEESMNQPDSVRWVSYKKLDSLAISYAPLVPLYYDQQLHFTQNNVRGMRSNPMNMIDLKAVRKY